VGPVQHHHGLIRPGLAERVHQIRREHLRAAPLGGRYQMEHSHLPAVSSSMRFGPIARTEPLVCVAIVPTDMGASVHVLYLIDSLVPGGAERSLAALAWEYRQRGLRLSVAYLHGRPGLQTELLAAGSELFPLHASGFPGWIAEARSVARTLRPDLIHTTLFQADVVGRVAGLAARVPVVSSLVNPEYGREQLADRNLRAWKVRAVQAVDVVTARNVARFHSLSAYVADLMAPRLLVPRSRIDVVPRGRDPEHLGERTPERAAEARASVEIDGETPLVVAVARQEYQKGLDLLLSAMPHLLKEAPDTMLLVAGRPGRLTPVLHAQIAELGIADAVRFLGVRTDVSDLLCSADAFVCPSRWEGFGGALIEAMALRAPVIAFDIPAIREVLGDETHAEIVRPRSPEALAQGIASTLHDRGAARDRAERARLRFLDRFTVAAVADGMISFYERALSR
jgi:glycosyltransferase involved in cell wall biosynthesis